MIAVPSRHRSLVLLGIALLAQVFLLAAQIQREHQVRLIRAWAATGVAPFERTGRWVVDTLRNGWSDYVGLRHARRENAALRAELERLELRNAELEGRAAEADRLAALLGFSEAHGEMPMVAARVIAASADPAGRTIYINRGERDAVRHNLPVITPEGVVGRVLDVYSGTAQVLLLTDRDSSVGALLAGTRVQGPVGGTGEPLLVMKYVTNDEEVAIGERVLTSGQDRIFPKDLPLGTVVEARPGNPFRQIRVKPAAHLESLEEVLVLLTQQRPAPAKEAQGPVAQKGQAQPAKPQ